MKYTRHYDNNKILQSYKCEKGIIKCHYFDITESGEFHKDYIACPNDGRKPIRYSLLREAKAYLEK